MNSWKPLTILTLLIIVIPVSGLAQEIEYVSSTLQSGGISAIVVSGDYAYCSLRRFLLTLNISDPTSPTLVASSPGLGGENAILRGNYIYFTRVYDYNPQVEIVDISEPTNPIEVLQFSGFAEGIFIDSSFIYLARENLGLCIFDNSNPTNPVQISTIRTHGSTEGVTVSGGYAYIADFDSGLTIVNVADPYFPSLAGRHNSNVLGSHRFIDIAVFGDYAYVADMYFGLRVFDVTNPALPLYWSSLNLDAYASKIIIDGNLAYLTIESLGEGAVYIVDISDPRHPALLGSYDAIGDPATFWKVDSTLYVGGLTNYGSFDRKGIFHLLDISNPANPTMLGSFELPQHSTSCVFAVGNYAYAGDFLFYMVDFSNAQAPNPLGYFDRTLSASDVWVRGDYAYVMSSPALKILSFADPANPIIAGQYRIQGEPRSIYCKDNYAYLACDLAGLRILDITDSIQPALVGSYRGTEAVNDVEVAGNYAYLAEDFNGLTILNIQDPANPIVAGRWQSSYYIAKVQVSGDYVYAIERGQLSVVNVSDPANPALVGTYGMQYFMQDIFVQGNLAYIGADSPNMLAVLDISNPDTPSEIASWPLPSFTYSIFVSGDMIYVATGNSLLLYRYPITSLNEPPEILPNSDLILNCYPNPFNSSTTIKYNLPWASDVNVEIYDIVGRTIEAMALIGQSAGNHSIRWDASRFASGFYFCKVEAGYISKTEKIILLK
jgi:hypothetical protein